MALTKGAFFHERSNNHNEAAAAAEAANLQVDGVTKKGFSIFGRKKSKSGASPPRSPEVIAIASHPPVASIPAAFKADEALKSASPARKPSHHRNPNVDDELRDHLRSEGKALLAFTDPSKAAAAPETSNSSGGQRQSSSRPDTSSTAKDGGATIRPTAMVSVEEKKSVKDFGPAKLQKPISNVTNRVAQPARRPPPVPEPLRDTFPSSPKPRNILPASPIRQGPQHVHDVKRNSIASIAEGPKRLHRTPSPFAQPQQPTAAQSVNSRPSNVPIERNFSDKSRTDSGKDVGRDDSRERLENRPVTKFPAHPTNVSPVANKQRVPTLVTPRPVSGLLSQDDPGRMDPRRMNRHSAEGPQLRRPSGAAYFQQSPVGRHLRPHDGAQIPQQRPITTEGSQRMEQSPEPSGNDASSHLAATLDERPRAFSLPIPVMLPPSSYSATPNSIQLSCVTDHRHSVLCTNMHHRIMCMVCKSDAPSVRWTCSYCALRFCSKCKSEYLAGRSFEDIIVRIESEEWQSQSAPASPVGQMGRNIHWELACVFEAGGRLGVPPHGRRPPQPGYRRRSPPRQMNGEAVNTTRNGKSSLSLSPDNYSQSLYPQPSGSPSFEKGRPSSASGKDLSDSSASPVLEDAPSVIKKSVNQGSPRGGRKTTNRSPIGRCATTVPAAMSGGSPADQRRALLSSGF